MYKPYTYQVYDPITGKSYIGSKYAKGCNPDNTKEYMGSPREGEYLEILRTRKHTLEKIILATWDTKEEVLLHEALLHDCFDVDNNPNFFNRSKQTSSKFSYSPDGKKMPRHGVEKMRKSLTGRARSEETRYKITKGLERYHSGAEETELEFQHKEHGNVKCTRAQLVKQFNLCRGGLSRLVAGTRSHCGGWTILKE